MTAQEPPRPLALRATFDTVADLYDAARPPIPDRIVDDLFDLAPARAVLEIGCGTGQLTRHLARRGCVVTAVELGANLASVARRLVPQATVVHADFDTWQPDRAYDLVCSSNAWGWTDVATRYARAHDALAPGGHLAIINGHHVVPPDADPFFRDIQEAYVAIGEPEVTELPTPATVGGRYHEEIMASGLFAEIVQRGEMQLLEYTAETYIDVLRTFSGHILMSNGQRATLFDAVRRIAGDRVIRKHHYVTLDVARRID